MSGDDDLLPLELAYEASRHAIEDQANVLESLRSRAGTVFAATALVTSFLGGLALANTERPTTLELALMSRPGIAIEIFVALAVLTLAILWPYRMRFSLSASEMIDIIEDRRDVSPVTAGEAYREVALRYEAMYDYNARWIRMLFWCFRLAIVCLVAEVAVWIAVLEDLT